MTRPAWARWLWVAVPFAVHLVLLQRLWFNAPVQDDYDTVLLTVLRLGESQSLSDWLRIVFSQHNEHRIAVTRLIVQMEYLLTGEVDFRVLKLIGSFFLLGTFAFLLAPFRAALVAPVAGAAAFLMFQWSYNESTLMGSAVLPHVGAVFFALGCLWFATRGGKWNGAASLALGILAAASQANGLFALPLAAAAAMLMGRRWRAALLALVAAAAWGFYFRDYAPNPGHPSAMAALSEPVAAIELFFVVLGGVGPGLRPSMFFGVAVLAGLAWLAKKRLWRDYPAAALFVAFLLASACATTVGRVGFGVFHASRYAVGSTCLVVILFLALHAYTRPWRRGTLIAGVAGAIAFSAATTTAYWSNAQERSLRGRLLAEAIPATPGISVPRYGGMQYPSLTVAERILARAGERALYAPRKQIVYAPSLATVDAIPVVARTYGFVDTVSVSGKRVNVTGWSDILAAVPAPALTIFPATGLREARFASVVRDDVALQLRDRVMLYSGYRLELDYASEEEAKAGAAALCLFIEAPERPRTRLARANVNCG